MKILIARGSLFNHTTEEKNHIGQTGPDFVREKMK